jgi:hypothetical protein
MLSLAAQRHLSMNAAARLVQEIPKVRVCSCGSWFKKIRRCRFAVGDDRDAGCQAALRVFA